ncbi:hypothetical protein [uncultured Dubosiella sp.]|jgi:hypothetical protein|uniref:hypothetical protein n=1 Tax=uncultured Dubosiella sp. TaxID=1937011 RepID=UPI0025EAA6C5|nr:hypothetical protein [uncultured Dubosiella sp.]
MKSSRRAWIAIGLLFLIGIVLFVHDIPSRTDTDPHKMYTLDEYQEKFDHNRKGDYYGN